MIVIAPIEKLDGKKEKEYLNGLTAKDKLFILSKSKEAVSVDIFNFLFGLKTKPEFVSLPDNADDFAEVFLFGYLSAKAKPDEEIRILSDRQIAFPFMTNIKWGAGSQTARTRTPKTPKQGTVQKTVRETEKEEKPEKEPFSPVEKYIRICPALKKEEDFLSRNWKTFQSCLQEASDAEIGYQFLLQTKLGKKDGNRLWEETHTCFDKLKG